MASSFYRNGRCKFGIRPVDKSLTLYLRTVQLKSYPVQNWFDG